MHAIFELQMRSLWPWNLKFGLWKIRFQRWTLGSALEFKVWTSNPKFELWIQRSNFEFEVQALNLMCRFWIRCSTSQCEIRVSNNDSFRQANFTTGYYTAERLEMRFCIPIPLTMSHVIVAVSMHLTFFLSASVVRPSSFLTICCSVCSL